MTYDTELLADAGMIAPDALREAAALGRNVQDRHRAETQVAEQAERQRVNRVLAETGIRLKDAPRHGPVDIAKMTEAAQSVWLRHQGVPVLRETSYTNADGSTVQVTGPDTMRLASDLYQLVERDYSGSPSIEAVQLEGILRSLQEGKPLSSDEWNMLNAIESRHADELAAWRDRGRDGQDAAVSDNGGRVSSPDGTEPVSESAALAALDAAGVPTREANAASSTAPLERADARPHEVVARLARAVPNDHPDRPAVDRLSRRGAALDAAERAEVDRLAAVHSDAIDEQSAAEVRGGAIGPEAALRELRVPLNRGRH